MKWFRSDNYSIPVMLAIGLHASIIIVGFVAVDFSESKPPEPKRPPIVNATVVDVSQTIIGKREADERAAKQQAAQVVADKKKRDAEQAQKKLETERRALEEAKRQVAQAKQAKEKAEAQERAALQQRENDKKQAAAKQQQQADEKEKKRLAQVADKKRQSKKEEEDKQQRELARKAEANRLAEEERKRKDESARLAAEEKALEEAKQEAAQAAAAEAKERAALETQMVQSISSLINSRVTSAWIRPPNARNNMKTQLRIFFLPNGEVMNVQITNGSGDALFDQRAVDAVYKVRKIEELAQVDSYVFERNFRQVDLIFNPQDLRN
ncbi:cell envelope integrity protein TolA [Marinomonas sp. IMCC 4694]|uniref:cell envelope integrity protein TolA n=1 Tax=Marinomonas sp. IMCC 4694 TaxID=2605432 RepID=UPI0011E61D64|nr:cell envelope integrity protein TolA [Marinomonas sp. IMCC 4694]TYL47807.1 cell envelope integrity protein TolA [Marinomonas sp. IMCC 4694]